METKEEIFSHFKTVIDNLIEFSPFYKNYFLYPYYLWEDEVDAFPGIILTSGSTRGCLIDENYDWVVKFNLFEEEVNFYDWCQQECDVFSLARKLKYDKYFSEVIFLGFYCAEVNAIPTDYSRQDFEEVERMYQDAAIEEYENLTIRIPLYAYHKESRDTQIISSRKTQSRLVQKSPLTERDPSIGSNFIEKYGEKEFNEFSTFLRAIRCDDLHGKNAFFNIEGNFKIIDYAGYHSNSSY